MEKNIFWMGRGWKWFDWGREPDRRLVFIIDNLCMYIGVFGFWLRVLWTLTPTESAE
jgi:hypothetical protein